MITYSRYINDEDHVWYDSSNVVYSKCYNNDEQTKTLKIVFSNGRTYVYRNVDVEDYVNFRNAESNGKAVNTYIIKKYKDTCVRIADTDMEKLSLLKEQYINEQNEIGDTKLSNIVYHIDFVNKGENNGQFLLSMNGKPLYSSKEGEVSIINLFKAMGIAFTMNEVDEIVKDSDENDNEIRINI